MSKSSLQNGRWRCGRELAGRTRPARMISAPGRERERGEVQVLAGGRPHGRATMVYKNSNLLEALPGDLQTEQYWAFIQDDFGLVKFRGQVSSSIVSTTRSRPSTISTRREPQPAQEKSVSSRTASPPQSGQRSLAGTTTISKRAVSAIVSFL